MSGTRKAGDALANLQVVEDRKPSKLAAPPNAGSSAAKPNQSMKYSMQYGASGDYFGHKDYYAAKAGGASDEDILKQLDANPETLRYGNVKGGGGLYDQIVAGNVPGDPSKKGNPNSTNQQASQDFKNSFTTKVADSYNAKGGTLSNSGDLQAGRDITFDNSVSNRNTFNNFGGDVRNFTYNAPSSTGGGSGGSGGGASYPSMNSYKDPALNATPVSAATMAGFYKPSDSPAAAAKRTTMHSELNRSKQEKYEGVGYDTANKYIQSADKANNINTKALSANLGVQPLYNQAQSDLITAQTFGDIWKYNPKDFYMPNPFEKPEAPDFEKMSNDIYDRIEG